MRAAIVALGLTLVYVHGSITITDAQRRRARPRGAVAASRSESAKYSKFIHHTHGKDSAHVNARTLICTSCHTIPSQTAPDRIADTRNPPVAHGYPYHNSCFDCHQQEIYRGARPPICTVCHTRVSPRATVQDVYPDFPKQNDLRLRQFPGYFPHKAHDRVIIKQPEPAKGASNAVMFGESFSGSNDASFPASRVTCAECHSKDERPQVAIPVGGDEKVVTPFAGTFKQFPSGHTSCFGCHWSANEPKKDNCDGCHLTAQLFTEKARHLLAPTTHISFADWPRDWPRRVSIKFRHEAPAEHQDEACVACHAGILQIDTLNGPDVSFAACFKCHRSRNPSIVKEMNEEDDDIVEARNNDPGSRAGKHTCSGCHTTLIGSAPPPCSHYLAFGDTYFNVDDYPKSAKQLEAQCKK